MLAYVMKCAGFDILGIWMIIGPTIERNDTAPFKKQNSFDNYNR